jgi:hypothetical protein
MSSSMFSFHFCSTSLLVSCQTIFCCIWQTNETLFSLTLCESFTSHKRVFSFSHSGCLKHSVLYTCDVIDVPVLVFLYYVFGMSATHVSSVFISFVWNWYNGLRFVPPSLYCNWKFPFFLSYSFLLFFCIPFLSSTENQPSINHS